jgi:glucose-1-phosphate adenylyltransferase
MDYGKLLSFHQERGADVSIPALRVRAHDSHHFGIMQVDQEGRVIGFDEKPEVPKTIPGNPEYCLASMGIYIFNAPFLFNELCRDATLPHSNHDFGRNIIPAIIGSRRCYAFPFLDENRKQDAYWRDVGTIDSYSGGCSGRPC